VLKIANPIRHAEVTEVGDGHEVTFAQIGEGDVREGPVETTVSKKGTVQWRAIAQEANTKFLYQVKILMPVAIVSALLHFVDPQPAFDGRRTIFNSCSKHECSRHI